MQKIIIKDFGPIKNCELFVKDYLVFIGPQASGKSTVSKGIYFFKSLRDDLIRYILESIEKDNFEKAQGTFGKLIRSKYLRFWGPTYHLDEIYLEYQFKPGVSIKITLESNKKYITPSFSPDFKREFENIVNIAKQFSEKRKVGTAFLPISELLEVEFEKRSIFNTIRSLANSLFEENKDLIFIPAGRSILATLSEQLQTINPDKIDYLMMAFLERINHSKSIFNKSLSELLMDKKKLTQDVIDFEKVKLAENLVKAILKGNYISDADGEKIYFSNNKYVKLSYSSSGQQEVIWILHLIFLLILDNKEIFAVIEEPEAHLFPEAQKQLIDLIFLMGNINGNQIVITTHSPYILSSFNNLLYANKIAQMKPDDVSKIVRKEFHVAADKVGAYYVNKGMLENLVDDELGLLMTERIDSVSKEINEEYYQMYNLED